MGVGGEGGGGKYQSRPPDRGEVGLKAPNIVGEKKGGGRRGWDGLGGWSGKWKYGKSSCMPRL